MKSTQYLSTYEYYDLLARQAQLTSNKIARSRFAAIRFVLLLRLIYDLINDNVSYAMSVLWTKEIAVQWLIRVHLRTLRMPSDSYSYFLYRILQIFGIVKEIIRAYLCLMVDGCICRMYHLYLLQNKYSASLKLARVLFLIRPMTDRNVRSTYS